MKYQLYATLLILQMGLFAASFGFAQQTLMADSIVRIKFHPEILGQDRELMRRPHSHQQNVGAIAGYSVNL